MEAGRNHLPCGACKHLRKRCSPDCIFAPHFPGNNPGLFTRVNRLLGAYRISKMLQDVPEHERRDVVSRMINMASMGDAAYTQQQLQIGCPFMSREECIDLLNEVKFLNSSLNSVSNYMQQQKQQIDTLNLSLKNFSDHMQMEMDKLNLKINKLVPGPTSDDPWHVTDMPDLELGL